MNIKDLDTPALLIDKNQVIDNISFMQKYADKYKVNLT